MSALGSIAHNAPKDYDVVFVNQPVFTGGRMFSRFPDHAGNTVQLHEWEQRGVVGLGAYLFSENVRRESPSTTTSGARIAGIELSLAKGG